MSIKVESVPLRSGTTAEWAATALILGVGEQGLNTDTGVAKWGDGVTPFEELPTPVPSTDGVGCVFFGGENLEVPINNTNVYCDFTRTDDPPRAPARDDLLLIDPEDSTTLNVIRSGLYDLTLNVPIRLKDVVYTSGAPGDLVDVLADVQFEVNGGWHPPAYDFNYRAYWFVTAEGAMPSITVNFTAPQVLLAGDTLQLRFKAQQGGLASITGLLELNPDITMVATYRGPVTLPE